MWYESFLLQHLQGMWAYNGHFQLHIHLWPLQGIVDCLICLAYVKHDNIRFKCQK